MPNVRTALRMAFIAAAVAAAGRLICAGQGPSFFASGPDAASYGAANAYALGTPATAFEKEFRVATFSHFDALFPARTVLPAARVWTFSRPAKPVEISYFHHGEHYSIQEYLQHLPITGLLIAKDNEILLENYQYSRTDKDRLTSQSMAKTMVAMLAGIALGAHTNDSVTDIVSKYVPELETSPYGNVSLDNLLHMESGITCQAADSKLGALDMQTLRNGCRQTAPRGTQFRYSAADSQVLGLIVQRIAGMSLARYLQETIWQQIGTESKASWTLDAWGNETPFCCFNATLRDYARFARLLAYDGSWNEKQLIPGHWLLDATTISDSTPQLAPGKSTPFFGYGCQTWIFPGPRRMFALLGANGQRIFVDPRTKLIMVQTAVMDKDVDRTKDAEMIGLWLSLIHRYGSEQEQ